MEQSQVVLHISDLHFCKDTTHENDARTLALGQLVQTIAEQPDEWHPSIICLTGDISRHGKAADYELAAAWLTALMNRFSLPIEALFICAGNHDVDRDVAKLLARPGSAGEADIILAFPPISEHYSAVFEAYSECAKQFGVTPYKLGDDENYLVGQRSYEGISFVALNTAWCSKDNTDKGQLWIGLPQIRHLEAKGLFVFQEDRSSLPITVTLLHHPKEWLHADESNAYNGRPNVWDYLSVRSDVVLSGHTHAEVRRADTIAETALYFPGGATYADKHYFNNFRLLRVENDAISYRTFEFDSRSAELRWESKFASTLTFPRRLSSAKKHHVAQGSSPGANIAALREKTEAHAARILELKSRAVKPIGELPHLTALQVAIKVEQEKYEERITPSGASQRRFPDQAQLLRLPFADALGRSRRTLLLGELGTGKSTLAASAVAALQSGSKSAIAFIVPAKQLELPNVITTGNLLNAISDFFSGSIAPALPPIQIQSLLKAQIETTVFLDGLDELESSKIAPLLREFAAMPEHWPTVRVIATGRPIELSGSVYSDWQIVTATTLTDENKQEIFENEALAEGTSAHDSRQHAVELIKLLQKTPTVAQVVSTPLAVRLFYSRIAKGSVTEAATLGDLVYDALQERLGGWEKKDSKQKTTEYFETYFPDADSRSALLGAVALDLAVKEEASFAEFRRILISKLQNLGALSDACAAEALDFFGKSGLVVVDDSVQFPMQVFLQMLRGYGLEENWRSKAPIREIGLDQWREVAFATTVARRKSSLSAHDSHLKQFISRLSSQDNFVPTAAQIVSESKSPDLGTHFVEEARARKSTRIIFFDDAWDESARGIATALKIAGPSGFSWFYDKYLDPRYPFVQRGSALSGLVFKEWARLSIGSTTADEKQKIRQVAIPMLKAETMQVHDIVASAVFLIPEAFDEPERLAFIARGLDTPQFSKVAEAELRECMSSASRQLCETVLLSVASPLAALIWTDYNPGIPPVVLLLASIRAVTEARNRYAERLVDVCKERLGIDGWTALLRFTLSNPDHRVATGAALALFDLGERNLILLRDPLVKALHDGGYVQRAEEILGDLLHQSGRDEVVWLAKVIHDHWEDLSGGHSGEFRLLLKNISKAPDGPSLLAWAIIGLGQFVLPRYPEVRQQFRDLLSGPNGCDFRHALRQKLSSNNPLERRAAAAVLVTCFPDEESIALQVVVRSISGGLGMRWHEWEEYLLSINFGPGPLVALKAKLPELPTDAAHFGYRLLLNNNIDLTADEQKQAIQGILEYLYRVRQTELTFLKSSQAASYLISLVKSSSGRFSQEAAELLLQLHKPSLSVEELALCLALSITNNRWNRFALSDQIEKLRKDSEYAKAVADLGTKSLAENSTRSLLDMLRVSLHDVAVWDDIVWRLMCEERVPMGDLGDPGFWLLEIGWRNPSAGRAIGHAAEKSLAEWVKRPHWSADVYQWLALVADEFAGVPKEQLEKIVLSSRAIHREVTAALLFRLGTIPSPLNTSAHFTGSSIVATSAYSEQELAVAARQTEVFPSGICERIEATITQRYVLAKEIAKLKQAGSNGSLIASVLAFTQGIPPEPDCVALVLPLMALARRPHQPGCLDRLIWIFKASQYEYLKANPATRPALMSVVEGAFARGDYVTEAALLLFDLRGYLDGAEVHRFLTYIVQRGYSTDREVQEATVRWLVQVRRSYTAHMPETLRAIKSSLAQIAEKHPDAPPAFFDEAIVSMILALSFWLLSGQEDAAATGAFWRGLKTLLKVQTSHALSPLLAAFEILEPLLVEVTPRLLRSAIASGRVDKDPFVRSAYVLFNSFGGITPQDG